MKRFSNIWILQFRFFVLILIHIHWLWLLEFYFWWSDIMEYKCNYSMAGGMSWPFKLFFEFKYCALRRSYAQQRSSRFCNWNFSFLFSTPKLSSLYKKLLFSIHLLNLFLYCKISFHHVCQTAYFKILRSKFSNRFRAYSFAQ